jgi:ribosomal protein S27E
VAGRDGGTDAARTPNIYRYNRSTNTYTQVGTLPVGVRSLGIRKVFDGRLLISGGLINESSPNIANYVEIENGGNYSNIGTSLNPRWGHGIGQINNDSCIVFGGGGSSLSTTRAECDWVNVSTSQISAGPPLPKGLASFDYATVPLSRNSSGQVTTAAVLVIGGVSGASEMQKETPRDTIFVLQTCTIPDSIKNAQFASSCLTHKLWIDSLNRCRVPTMIKWNFGDATTGQTGPWSTTHTFPANGTYYVKATLLYADCADSLVLLRPVNITSSANIVSSPRVLVKCAKDTAVQLHATGGVRYLWSPGSTLSDSTSANPIAHPTQDTKYVVYGWTADSCRGVDTVFVRVSNGKANAGPDLSMCSSGDSVFLSVSVPGGLRSVRWTPKFGLTCDTCATTVAKPTTTTSYIATVIDTAGCVLLDTIRVNLRTSTAAKISGGPTMNICAGSDSITLSLTSKLGVRQVKWTPNIGLGCDTCIVTKAKPKASLTYTVQITDSLGCVVIDTILVKVGSGSTQIQSGGPQYICYKGDSAVISVNGKVKAVLWSPASLVSCSTCPQTLVKPSATRYFSFIAVDSSGCTLNDSIKVTVLPKSTVDIAPDTVLCGSTALLMNVYGQYQSINWSPAAGLSCTNCPTVLVTPTPGKTITYYVTAHNGKSVDCDSRDSIRVRFAPGIEGQLADQSLCPGDSIVIKLRPFGGKVSEKAVFSLDEFKVPFFSPGYYIPATTQELNDLRLRFSYNLLGTEESTKYIVTPSKEYNDYARTVDSAFDQMKNFVLRVMDYRKRGCTTSSEAFRMKVEAFADAKSFSPGARYNGADIDDEQLELHLKQGTLMTKGLMATLRAYYTIKVLELRLSSSNLYQEYHNRLKWRIVPREDDENAKPESLVRKVDVGVE